MKNQLVIIGNYIDIGIFFTFEYVRLTRVEEYNFYENLVYIYIYIKPTNKYISTFLFSDKTEVRYNDKAIRLCIFNDNFKFKEYGNRNIKSRLKMFDFNK